MSSSKLSPTANLLRKSRFFSLPPPLPGLQSPPTSRAVFGSDTATLPYPLRASLITPGSSLAKGDWGLKRPLPHKSTSGKSSRPVIRVIEQDTFEHVTDFESASDHVMTLEKFQDMNIPISLLNKARYSSQQTHSHNSPFEERFDNAEASEDRHKHDAKVFRQLGPSLANLTEAEFSTYLKKIQREKSDILRKFRQLVESNDLARRRKIAQDRGEDMENIRSGMDDKEFAAEVRALRAQPALLGPIIYELLDIPSVMVFAGRIRGAATSFQAPPTKLAALDYTRLGQATTHPSGGLSYLRSHSIIYNHPQYGPQAAHRPIQARILQPKVKSRGGNTRAVAGIAGIAVEDLNAMNFSSEDAPAGLGSFDATIPGGPKYWVSLIRAFMEPDGKILLASLQATAASKAVYGLEDYKPPTSPRASQATDNVFTKAPLMDTSQPYDRSSAGSVPSTGAATGHLLKSMGGL